MPTGLVRYNNRDAIEKKLSQILHPGLIIYIYLTFLTITISLFVYVLFTKKDFEPSVQFNFAFATTQAKSDYWITSYWVLISSRLLQFGRALFR